MYVTRDTEANSLEIEFYFLFDDEIDTVLSF